MKISIKNKRNLYFENGFTLIELVVVIAGLTILGGIAIPGVLTNIKLAKIDEAKAIMNGYISDCLGQYRISTDPNKFYSDARPENLDEVKLATLGYKVGKGKCSWTSLEPSDDKDSLLYSFDYRISADGKVLKTGIPSADRSLNSCRGWAGANCSLSPEKAAQFAAAAALAAKKNQCLTAYAQWKVDNGDGNTVTWNNDTNACDKTVWLFNGTPVADQAAYDALVKQKYGTVCQEWKDQKKQSGYISKKDDNGLGIGETIEECNKAKYWFHSGQVPFTTQVAWYNFNLDYQAQACNQSKTTAINNNHKGSFVYGPHSIPTPPCGRSVYLCGSTEYQTEEEYQKSSCYTPPGGGGGGNQEPVDRCIGVVSPGFCVSPFFKNNYDCRCYPGGIWRR
tara:strand:+ start:1232 stop:2413 length:1182 start_codon:yes stop_codon:yes gene_type:complete